MGTVDDDWFPECGGRVGFESQGISGLFFSKGSHTHIDTETGPDSFT